MSPLSLPSSYLFICLSLLFGTDNRKPQREPQRESASHTIITLISSAPAQVPRKRLIIGQNSFDLDRDGQLMTDEEEYDTRHNSPNPDSPQQDEEEEEKNGDAISDGGEVASDSGDFQKGSLTHKDSVWSMASSATSVDSTEEELREQRRRLQLSLSRRPLTQEVQEAPLMPAEPQDAPPMVRTPFHGTSVDLFLFLLYFLFFYFFIIVIFRICVFSNLLLVSDSASLFLYLLYSFMYLFVIFIDNCL